MEAHIPKLPQSAGWRYGAALVAFGASFYLREALNPWLFSDRGFVLFVPAILLIAFIAGLGPSLLTTALSGIAVWYFFIPPLGSFRLEVEGTVDLAVFFLSSGTGLVLVHVLRTTISQLDVERANAEADLIDMTRIVKLGNRLAHDQKEGIYHSLDAVIETAIAISGADKANVQLLELQILVPLLSWHSAASRASF